MTDIDFDELDKAVNSLMNKHQENTGQSTEEPAKTPETDPAPAAPEKEAFTSAAKPLTVSRPTPVKTQPSSMISSHSSGRFMDVVHPSSQMVSGRKMASAPSRTGESAVSEAETDETNVPTDVLATPAATETENQSTNAQSFSGDDFMAGEATTTAAATTDTASPFLTNATVQKRPLGPLNETVEEESVIPSSLNENDVEAILNGIPSEEEVTPEVETAAEEDTLMPTSPEGVVETSMPTEETPAPVEEAPVAEKTAEVADPGIQLVDKEATAPEFDKELMAIEETDVEEVAEEPVTEAVNQESVLPKEPSTPVEPAPIAKPAAGDIPQQYAVEDIGVADPEAEPMYDTAAKASSEPKHQEKKKGGWLTVLLILLFLAIGIGGGAAAYYLLIQ